MTVSPEGENGGRSGSPTPPPSLLPSCRGREILLRCRISAATLSAAVSVLGRSFAAQERVRLMMSCSRRRRWRRGRKQEAGASRPRKRGELREDSLKLFYESALAEVVGSAAHEVKVCVLNFRQFLKRGTVMIFQGLFFPAGENFFMNNPRKGASLIRIFSRNGNNKCGKHVQFHT